VPHAALDALLTPLVAGIEATGPAVLLTPKIAAGYRAGCAQLAALAGIREIAVGRASGAGAAETARIETGSKVLPRLFLTEAARWSQLPELQQEIFGPATVLISYQRLCELTPVLASLHGQLTATVYGSDADFAQSGVNSGVNSGVGSGVNSGVSSALPAQPTANQPAPGVTPPLLWQLAQKAGRIIRNQMPTGVEVCAAMNHGGPFPASTDLRYTAVGSSAIRRFQRPLCQQNLG
jgi:NADP-dependent aldehyde dehydrogenase